MSARTIQAGKAVIVVDILDRTKASFNKIASGLMKGSRALRDMGTNAAGATLLTGIAAKNVIGTYIKFEDQMLSLSAKLGMFGIVTKKQDMILKGLESTIINLGKQTSYTSAEVADAAISLAQAGFSADAITASLQSVLDLARGTGYALGDSADLLANAIKTFNIFGENDSIETRMQKINQVSSQFVKATRLGTIEIEDLRESLKYASGSAHNLGVELPVLLGFLVQMSESGLKASLAGTSLNTALLNMIKNSEKLQALDPTFTPTTDSSGNMDMAKTFNDIMKMTNKLSKMKKVEVFGDIFNIRGARMVSSVQEMEQVESFIKQISLAGEEARLAAAKMESGVGGAVRRATSSWEALEIAMGRVFKKEATGLANFSTLLIDSMEGLVARNKKLIAGFLLSPVVFGAVAIGALSLSFILARLSTVVSSLAYAFKGLKNVGGIMAGGAKSLASPLVQMNKTRLLKASAIKTQAAKVAKLQAAVDIMYAKAGAKKTVAAQQAAIAKVAASKKAASLATAVSSLQKMRGGGLGIGGMLSAGKNTGTAIKAKMKAVAAVVAERKEIKAQVGLERILSRQQAKKNALALAGIKDTPVDESARLAKTVELNKASIAAKHKAANLNRLATLEGKKTLVLEKLRSQMHVGDLYKQRAAIRNTARSKNPALNASLKAREAELTVKINKATAVKQQITDRIAASQAKVTSLQTQAAKATKLSATYAGRASRSAHQIKMAENINYTNSLRRNALTAKSSAQGAASAARLTRAGKALKGASIGKTLFSGMSSGLSFTKMFAGIGKGISGISQLTFAFGRLATGLTRFVFSWNFVGLALNALLLFGNKIPAVKKAFDDIGNGISLAFGQIAKIATYAKPAMDLFSLAFEAFVSGDTQTGIDALSAGFSGLVAIIQNQLSAAWSSFMSQVSYLWDTLQVIGQAIMMIVDSIISGVSAITGALSSRMMQGISDMFSGSGGSTFGESMIAIIGNIAFTIDNLLTGFSKIVITLNEYLLKFLDKLQYVLGEVISKIPGTGSGGQQLMDGATSNSNITELEASRARANLNRDSTKRKKDLAQALSNGMKNKSGAYRQDAVDANKKSQAESQVMTNRFEMFSEQFRNNMAIQQAKLQAQMNAQGNIGIKQPGQAQIPQMFATKLEALIGSVGETRARFKVTSEKTMEEISRDQLTELKGIKSAIGTAGAF